MVPSTGSLRVTTASSGSALDEDGFQLRIDDGTGQAIGPADTLELSAIAPGDHSLVLTDLAANCRVLGSNPRTVPVEVGSAVDVGFQIECAGPGATGSLAVVVATRGVAFDADGYRLALDPSVTLPIGVTDSVTLPGLAVGSQLVRLAGIASNCAVDGENPRTLVVSGTEPVVARFDVVCWAPPTGKILFARSHGPLEFPELYVVRADGTGLTELNVRAVQATWSPDGSKFAFVDFSAGIVVADSSALEFSLLAGCRASDGFAPQWSPDGTRLLCLEGGVLHVARSDGPRVARLTPDSLFVTGATWSPDGSQVVLHRAPGEPDFGFAYTPGSPDELYLVNADGTGLLRLADLSRPEEDGFLGRQGMSVPRWSPQGTRIAFHRALSWDSPPSGNPYLYNDIYTIEADGSGLAAVTNGREFPGSPVWSPDGGRIAFASDSLYVVSLEGGRVSLMRALPDSMAVYDFGWSPDGTKLVIAAGRVVTDPDLGVFPTPDLYIINADGFGLVRLTGLSGPSFFPNNATNSGASWVP